MKYEVVIGLEVHIELKTKSKIFCSCPNEFGAEPNTNVCPGCLGLPGSLPLLNEKVVEYAVKAGLALNCDIAEYSKFDRKNYFYPDNSTAYQISQFYYPICNKGYLDIKLDDQEKRIGITRIHLEEDAGKLVHEGDTITASDSSLVDYNRAGVPLIEIVTEPDLRSSEEAGVFLEKLKSYIEYTGVSDVKMEQGSLRCDANVSIRPFGQEEYGVRSEVKNLNSFRAVQRAIDYEVERHIEILEEGGQVEQETRSWDDGQGITLSMRGKEEANDYRYFPEPNLVPIIIDQDYIEEIRETMPELPDHKKQRLIDELDLPEYDAGVITSSRAMATFFDETVALYSDAKKVSNWLMVEYARLLNAAQLGIEETPIQPKQLAQLLLMVDEDKISGRIAKTVFEEMFTSGKDPEKIVEEQGLVQISDEGALTEIIAKVMAANPKSVEDYKGGNKRAIGFLVGQVMKETGGQANPGMVNKMLAEKLKD